MDIVYINGEFVPINDAKISILDRGFLFGDSVYEVIPFNHGKLFEIDSHLQRLNNSLSQIDLIFDATELQPILATLLEKNQQAKGFVYLQITRGTYAKRHHDIPVDTKPTIVAFLLNQSDEAKKLKQRGLKVTLLDDIRWQRCDIKTTSLLPNVLLQHQAKKDGFDTAILIHDGYAQEAPVNNLFVVKDDVLYTPPSDNKKLAGITQKVVTRLCSDIDLPLKREPINVNLLESADEIWLTSSTKGVCPVKELNGNAVGQHFPGPYWQKMNELLENLKQQL